MHGQNNVKIFLVLEFLLHFSVYGKTSYVKLHRNFYVTFAALVETISLHLLVLVSVSYNNEGTTQGNFFT